MNQKQQKDQAKTLYMWLRLKLGTTSEWEVTFVMKTSSKMGSNPAKPTETSFRVSRQPNSSGAVSALDYSPYSLGLTSLQYISDGKNYMDGDNLRSNSFKNQIRTLLPRINHVVLISNQRTNQMSQDNGLLLLNNKGQFIHLNKQLMQSIDVWFYRQETYTILMFWLQWLHFYYFKWLIKM